MLIELRNLVHKGLETSKWIHLNKHIKLDFNSYSKFVSNIADKLYKHCPKINSELLNRTKPSGTANGAASVLIKHIFKYEGEDNLGFYDGYPAARGLFESIVANCGIYKNNKFIYPDENSDLFYLWQKTDEFLNDKPFNVNLIEIYKMWSSEIGLKSGLHNLVMSLYIASNRNKVAVYLEDVYQTELCDIFCDYISKTPKYISIRYIDSKNEEKAYLKALSSAMRPVIKSCYDAKEELHSFDLAKSLISFISSLNGWVLRTSSLSKQTATLREKLKNAHDPNSLIYDVIPAVYDSNTQDYPNWIDMFKSSLEELRDKYPDLIKTFARIIAEELDHNTLDKGVIDKIKTDAKNIRGKSGDFRLDGFATRLYSINENSIQSLDAAISMTISKPIYKWIDTDISRAKLSLYELLAQFKRVVKLTTLKSDNKNLLSFAIPKDNQLKIHSFESKENKKLKATIKSLLSEYSSEESLGYLLDICKDIVETTE